jgi:hypothetical protein
VEQNFRPSRKAHPAFTTSDLDELRHELLTRGINVVEDVRVPGVRRFFAEDPWGNRLEFIEQQP